MDLEKLEKLARLVLKDFSLASDTLLRSKGHLDAEFTNLMVAASISLPDYQSLFQSSLKNVSYIHEAKSIIEHLLSIVEMEKTTKAKTVNMKIFESAEEKMKQANLSFRKEDYTSCFSNLDTALEMVLKDKIRIPLTITKVNIAKIVDILVSHKVEPYLYLVEARKHITQIDNKIKHQGYSPSKSDCIFGIKAMEELISRLWDMKMELTDEVRNKIHEGL